MDAGLMIFLIIGLPLIGALIAFLLVRFVFNGSNKNAQFDADREVQEAKQKVKDAQDNAQAIQKETQIKCDREIQDAKRQAESLKREAIIEAKDEILKLKQDAERENRERLKEVRNAENRISQREESLDRRHETLDLREKQLADLQVEMNGRMDKLKCAEQEVIKRLESVAGMTSEEAKMQLLENLQSEVVQESAEIIRNAEQQTKAEADKNARNILSLAIQRVAADHSAETTVTTIQIPNDDIKGRIIGREGRNIRSFEQITGTDLIIDDTPECITVTCFDPVRREIARVTMENLVADGRIHPARIEEMYEKAKRFVNDRVKEAGEQASFDTGIHDLSPEIVYTLGRLRYRTSFGQNVLNHSMEVAYLSGVIASELGLDPVIAKRAGLLHDLGKAIDHEVEGSHAVIGADLARKYNEDPEIVHAIAAHHNDVEPNSVLDVIVQAADAASAARPGARRESFDAYIKRLEKLEEIANEHEGVERTYAIQAGRELRVMVKPEDVDEAKTIVMAHDIARKIEEEVQYSGQVKVVVIRESRAEDIAK